MASKHDTPVHHELSIAQDAKSGDVYGLHGIHVFRNIIATLVPPKPDASFINVSSGARRCSVIMLRRTDVPTCSKPGDLSNIPSRKQWHPTRVSKRPLAPSVWP